MCNTATEWISSPNLRFRMQKTRSKRFRAGIHGLNRRKRSELKNEKNMELKNLRLYMENMSILENNEKLRKKAILLHQENLALMSQLQKKTLSVRPPL